MKITYDPSVDILYIELNENEEHHTDSESLPGLSVIYDESGQVCAIEVEAVAEMIADYADKDDE